MHEPRPLPMGRREFDEWADRIISGALVPNAIPASQRAAIASMILHLGPHESHKPDAHFIHALRKGAVNQVAHAVFLELQDEAKKRTAEEEAEKLKAVEASGEATLRRIGTATAP